MQNIPMQRSEIRIFYGGISKETLNKSFLPFFTTLSVMYFRALLKTAKRMLRIIQLFPKLIFAEK